VNRILWLSPSPLWDDYTGGPAFRRPAVLRFASDAFMQELQGTLESRPAALRRFVARPETWRRPAAGLPPRPPPAAPAAPAVPAGASDAASEPLKLYQPVQGRFYLVTAALACRVPGLPEHTVDLAAGESVGFVIRRIVRDAGGAERAMAWVTGEGGAGWTDAPASGVLEAEERLPLFGTFFQPENEELRRRLFAGFIPVDRREQYVGAREVTNPPATSGPVTGKGGEPAAPAVPAAPDPITVEDSRVLDFQREVLEPWVELMEWYDAETDDLDQEKRVAGARQAAVQATPLILLDLALWMRAELPAIWQVVEEAAAASTLVELPAQKAVYYQLANFRLWKPQVGNNVPPLASDRRPFWDAVRNAYESRDDLEKQVLELETDPRPPASFTAVLITVDPRLRNLPSETQALIDIHRTRLNDLLGRDDALPEDAPRVRRRGLLHLVMNALQEARARAAAGGGSAAGVVGSGAVGAGADGTQAPRLPALAPLDAQGDDEFVIHCVYQRPHCGRTAAPLVSDPSERFRLASFFDPDAPQRTIRVGLPVDTTPAALRKYDRSVTFVLSNELRKQISRVKGMKELMDGDVGPPRGLDISVICSLSIPIITICALIILMLMVNLLNIIFWWIPFFKICLPVPTLKAKG
jgi:hypothetical protein